MNSTARCFLYTDLPAELATETELQKNGSSKCIPSNTAII